jgi:hypothetical protein
VPVPDFLSGCQKRFFSLSDSKKPAAASFCGHQRRFSARSGLDNNNLHQLFRTITIFSLGRFKFKTIYYACQAFLQQTLSQTFTLFCI